MTAQKQNTRWYPLFDHPEQVRLVNSPARFKAVAAGGRSGKTEIEKREGVMVAMRHPLTDARIIFAAPTRDQAKEIYWEDLKALVPRSVMSKDPMETSLTIRLVHGPSIRVVGMDKPQRIEGAPIDWICLDEYRDMKPDAWDARVSPMLSTRGRPPGQARLIGRPRPGHFQDVFKMAQKDKSGEWDTFHWSSEDILTATEIASAKRRMDPFTYAQEYKADWINFEGRAYYPFHVKHHATEPLKYDSSKPLIFCFDFNVDPGVCAILQEQEYRGNNPIVADQITAVIGEVWIPRNSTTKAVCNRLIKDWKHHQGEVHCYGDFTGGARGTAQERGSNWDIIKQELEQVGPFGGRMMFDVRPNPGERSRINSLNTRLESADGLIHLLIDPVTAQRVIDDFDGVVLLKGGSGELEKLSGGKLTHLTDAIGYYVYIKHPIFTDVPSVQAIY